jgi:EmrB/QacA subfamily drug resistance transporter
MKSSTLALVVIASVTLMLVLDTTIVNVALPTIRTELGFDAAGLEWVVTGYAVAYGGLLLTGGRAGDLFGRRRMFMVGIAVFSGASLLCGLATSSTWLVAARVLQGMGAAIANPTALALIATTFPTPAARGRAMGVYATMAGAGSVLGLLLGGVLTDLASWRWVFFINVPIGAAALILAPRVLTETPGTGGRLDLPGAATVTAGMALLVDSLVHAAQHGWGSFGTLLPLLMAGALLAAFVVIEARSPEPLVPLSLLADRTRALAYLVIPAVSLGLYGTSFFLVLLVQDRLRLSPLLTGIGFLPLAVGLAVTATMMGRAAPRIGTRPGVVLGPLVAACGALCLALVSGTNPTYAALLARC